MFRISNKNKRTFVFITYTKQKWYHNQTKTVAWSLPNIGYRTQSDRAADGIRFGGVRNPIGLRSGDGEKSLRIVR
jgi:hypothetical protein